MANEKAQKFIKASKKLGHTLKAEGGELRAYAPGTTKPVRYNMDSGKIGTPKARPQMPTRKRR